MSVRRSRTPPPTKEHPSLASGWLERKSGLLDKWSRVRAAIERPKAGQTAYRLSIAEANGWDTNSSDCYILCPGVVIQEITNIGQQAIEILSARRCLEDGSDERLEKPLVLRVPEDSAISFRGWQHALQECITDSPPPRPRRLNLEVPARLTAASSSGNNSAVRPGTNSRTVARCAFDFSTVMAQGYMHMGTWAHVALPALSSGAV